MKQAKLQVLLDLKDKMSSGLKNLDVTQQKLNSKFDIFKAKMKNINPVTNGFNRKIANLSGQLSKTQGLKNNINQLEKYKQSHNKITTSLNKNQQALTALNSKRNLGKKLTAAQENKIAKLTAAIKHNKSELSINGRALNKTKNQLQKAGINTNKLTQASNKLSISLIKQKSHLITTANSMKRLQKIAARTKTKLAMGLKLAPIAILGGSAGLFSFLKSTANQIDKIAKTSKNLGISNAALQSFRILGELSDVSSDKIDNNLKKLNVVVGQLKTNFRRYIANLIETNFVVYINIIA